MNKEEQIKLIEDKYPFTTHHNSVRRTRHSFFSNIQTELQAYLLGFYAADGSINEKRKTLRIHLSKIDDYIVYLYKDIICPDARIFTKPEGVFVSARTGKLCKSSESVGVDINSTFICNDLVSLGFGYRKTYTDNHLPKINDSLLRHFIRGYFDGDGSIIGSYIKPDPKWHKNERFRIYIKLLCKTRGFLDEIQQWLQKYDIKSSICQDNRDNLFHLNIGGSQIKKIYDLFYKDSYFFLKRKKDKFDHYVNTEVSQLIAEHRNA